LPLLKFQPSYIYTIKENVGTVTKLPNNLKYLFSNVFSVSHFVL